MVQPDMPWMTEQYGACASLHAGYLRLQTQTHNMKFLLLPTVTVVAPRNLSVTFIRTLPVVFCVTFKKIKAVSNTSPNTYPLPLSFSACFLASQYFLLCVINMDYIPWMFVTFMSSPVCFICQINQRFKMRNFITDYISWTVVTETAPWQDAV